MSAPIRVAVNGWKGTALARTTAENQALLREIDEAVREDDVRRFWLRYGRIMAIVVVLGLAAFAGWLFWQNYRNGQAQEASERYAKAIATLDAAKPAAADVAALAAEGPSGYRTPARLVEAGIKVGAGDRAGAISAYKSVADDTGIAQPWRDLATIRQTALEFDTMAPQAVIDRLKPLSEAGSPWFGSAGEMSGLAWLKLGKPDLAAALFAAIAKDPGVPRTIQTRAVQMASLLGVDAQVAPRPGTEDDKDNAANAE